MDKHNLRAFLGIREWLYFEMSCNPPAEPITLCRVDTATGDLDYLHHSLDEWTRVANGIALNPGNGYPFVNQWLIDMLESFYG
jgi:hypothetical protein